jgi:hypothetical protein
VNLGDLLGLVNQVSPEVLLGQVILEDQLVRVNLEDQWDQEILGYLVVLWLQ